MAGNKKSHNIYLIDSEKVVNDFKLSEHCSNIKIVEAIMSIDNRYQIQELKSDINTNSFDIVLYFSYDLQHKSKLSLFCSSFVKEDQDAVNFYPQYASSVLFVWKNEKIYAITTGQGFRIVENYSVLKFGMKIATLFDQYLRITSLGSNEMSSVIHSAQTTYTTEVDFKSVQTLDAIFKEIGGRINNKELVHTLLNLDDSSKKNSLKLKAKDYLQFGCTMDLTGLLHLLRVIDELDISQLDDGFNAITPLSPKSNSGTIQEINEEIIVQIFKSLSNGEKCPFELFYQDTEKYIFADQYQVYSSKIQYTNEEDYDATHLLNNAFGNYLDGAEWDIQKFNDFINNSRIRTTKEDRIITDGSIISHFSGEVDYKGKTYFVLDGKYYCQNQSYVERLNEFLRIKIRPEIYTQEIKTKWKTSENEDWFNATVAQNEGYIELHRQLIDNIEFADLIKYTNGVFTVVHVKDGFDGAMRVLDRQVEMSLKMLLDVKGNNNHSFMKRLYQKAVLGNVKTGILTQFQTENDFINAIKNSKVRYIIVIRPSKEKLLECKSNVAKHCLNALFDRCFHHGVELNIQIK